jgi:triosephosphate isomerase
LAVAARSAEAAGVDLVLCPPAAYLETVGSALGLSGSTSPSGVTLGGQTMHDKGSGAFTGEVAPPMLVDLGCRYVILGHSERRHKMGETDAQIKAKLVAAQAAGLEVILCLGETLAEREAGNAHRVIETQLRGSLAGHSEDALATLVVAYEPVWAIGTGRTATPDDAADAHRTVRKTLASMYSARFSEQARVIYGGSVNAKNAADLFAREEIDGGLVGGASLDAADFAAIVAAASSRRA